MATVTEQAVYYGHNVSIKISPSNSAATQFPDIFTKAESYTRTHTIKYDDRYPLKQKARDRHVTESNGTVEATGPLIGAIQSSLIKRADAAFKNGTLAPTFTVTVSGVGNDGSTFVDTLLVCHPETETQTATGGNKAVDSKLVLSYEHIT